MGILDAIKKHFDDAFERISQREQHKKYLHEFEKVDSRALSKMDDKELAEWQSGYPLGTPQHIYAEHEWQRRLMAGQIKNIRYTAYISAATALVGVIVGHFI